MASSIKGITVKLGADTTALSTALKDVNKESRDIQSELKQVERLLKLDPTNTILLNQKKNYLISQSTQQTENLKHSKMYKVKSKINLQMVKLTKDSIERLSVKLQRLKQS